MAHPKPQLPVESSEKAELKAKGWTRFGFARWIGREESPCTEPKQEPPPKPSLGRRWSRKVVPGLPRPATFRRQNSERREKLTPAKPSINERRTVSVDRRQTLSTRPTSPPCVDIPNTSISEARDAEDGFSTITRQETWSKGPMRDQPSENLSHQSQLPSPPPPPPGPNFDSQEPPPPFEDSQDNDIDEEIRDELERKWILNLSMHFRDHSPREKFFLTYAETPQKWRRVTVSCDYRDAPQDSLERDLQSLQYQRDKSARIYESIRSSLSDIQFYESVTNLKLETKDDRLHVHVTEDTNEIIPYPGVHAVQHLNCPRYTESELHFESHMSGFVYKVKVHEQIWIKKEIPGPDSVDEFLYEINALNELVGSRNVIQFKGLVVDESRSIVKGLLIDFAEQGALVDILYDNKGKIPWSKRERWAKQIVEGLSEIHEAGFVQGDFTLSNIVIDENGEAKIIDINRRGCPVGWEPPEISALVESGQRVAMYIGVKSDLYQLGMVLWALAKDEDEPERKQLVWENVSDDIPLRFIELVDQCLNKEKRNRPAAKDLLLQFSDLGGKDSGLFTHVQHTRDSSSDLVEYSKANNDFFSFGQDNFRKAQFARGDYTYDSRAGSVDIPFDGPGSCIVSRRGRQPPANMSHLSISDHSRDVSPGHSESAEPQIVAVSPTGEHRWQEVEMNGTPYLIQRNSLHIEDSKSGTGDVADELRREFTHVDSGLADMDLAGIGGHEMLMDPKREFTHVDSGLADMHLAGIGGYEMLTVGPKEFGEMTPRARNDDFRLEGYDEPTPKPLQP